MTTSSDATAGSGAAARRRVAAPVAVLLTAVAMVVTGGLGAGCGAHPTGRWSDPGDPGRASGAAAGATASAAASGQPGTPGPSTRTAPATAFGVGVRTINLSRAPDRPLPTTVWYPATGSSTTARANATVAAGRFPLLLFSHGLGGLPAHYAGLTTRLAAAGFVVAAPAYPKTSQNAAAKDFTDVANQPADALFVIESVLALDQRAGDPFAGHLDPQNVAAAGHSAGGFTTAGMLAARHDARLRGAVIIAGGSMGAVTTPSVPVLFVHGDNDKIVGYATGRSAYDRLTWPKAFLTVTGGDHGEYLNPGRPGSDAVLTTVRDFLRATLYADQAARFRLTSTGTSAGTRFEQALG